MSETATNSPTPASAEPHCSNVAMVPPLSGGQRPETGAMQFGEDWPGVFIRGDTALYLSHQLNLVLTAADKGDTSLVMRLLKPGLGSVVRGLRNTLESCRVN